MRNGERGREGKGNGSVNNAMVHTLNSQKCEWHPNLTAKPIVESMANVVNSLSVP
jgi:hypothetical protein